MLQVYSRLGSSIVDQSFFSLITRPKVFIMCASNARNHLRCGCRWFNWLFIQKVGNSWCIQINIIVNMELSKSPKSIAYSRLGKPHFSKPAGAEQNFGRKSTGNIYEDLVGEFDPKQERYIRELVSKNSKDQAQTSFTSPFHSRRKSYADLQIQHPTQHNPKHPKSREQRETLSKTRPTKDLPFPHQATPKNNHPSQMTRSDFINRSSLQFEFQTSKITSLVRRPPPKQANGTFLQNLSSYLEQLGQADDYTPKGPVGVEKLSETLKISYGNEDGGKYASKIQQQMLKIKQLKLRNHYAEKELAQRDKREARMKHCLYEMLQEIKQLTTEMHKEKKERKRLEKAIQHFEMRNQQFERKTIGKSYNLSKIQQFQSKINELSQNQQGSSQLDASFRQIWKQSVAANSKAKPPYMGPGGLDIRYGQLDATQIEKILRSNYQSDDEQGDLYQ